MCMINETRELQYVSAQDIIYYAQEVRLNMTKHGYIMCVSSIEHEQTKN